MKKLILLPFLVFGQFLANAQMPTQKAQNIITLKLLPAGPVHLPKKDKDKGKDKNQLVRDQFELPQSKNLFMDTQVIETGIDEKKPDVVINNSGRKNEEPVTPAKSRSVIHTISSL